MTAEGATSSDLVVRSADGTRIAASVAGSGPPVILVHGAIGDRTSFRYLAPLLADRFTVVSVDRRGRGGSDDPAGSYAIDQEFADIAAVADSLGEPADAVGHSYGASVALGAATLTGNLRRLVLYEPSPGITAASPGFLGRLDALIDDDRRDEALALALTEFAGFGPDDLEAYRSSPLWAPRVAAAHTIAREVRAEAAFVPDRRRFGRLTSPILFLLGSESPDWARRGMEAIASVVEDHRVVRLEGQGHMATVTAPGAMADAIGRFLTS